MPSASDRDRDLMSAWFGGIDLFGPLVFLKSHGYEDRGGMLVPPVSAHTVSFDEWRCIRFLCDEWDFGFMGVVGWDD